MRNSIFLVLVGVALFSITLPAQAAISPLAVSIVSPVQFPSSDFAITGARASLFWGDHRNVYGLDLGVIGNMTTNDFGGIAVAGIFNLNRGSSTIVGLQAAGVANINRNKSRVVGVQAALGMNSNQAESTVIGLQVAAVNLAEFTNIWGVQAGLWNHASEVRGFQIGIINTCNRLHGIQIGLLNFHKQGLFSVAPIINVGF